MPKTLSTIIRQIDLDCARGVDVDWGQHLTLKDGMLSLRQNPNSGYYLGGDWNGAQLSAGCQMVIGVFKANDLRELLGFQAKIHHAKKNSTQVTKAAFKVSSADGLTDYLWNGAAWVVDTDPTHWNTEDEVSTNLPTFTPGLDAKSFAVKCQLGTDDRTFTPKFEWMKVGMRVDTTSFLDDALRALAAALRTNAPFLTDFDFKMPADGTTVDLAAVAAASGIKGFRPLAADAVYDLTADPGMATDLYVDMASATVANLSATVTGGHTLRVRMQMAVPVVIESTDPDYTQVQQVPMIQLRAVRTVEGAEQPVDDHVTHKYDRVADLMHAPLRETLEMDIALLAPNGSDLRRMIQRVGDFFQGTPAVFSPATGESYRLWLRGKFRRIGGPEMSGLAQAQATLQIPDVLMFRSSAANEQVPLVARVTATSYVGSGARENTNGDAAVSAVTLDSDNAEQTGTVPLGDLPN